MAMTLEQQRAIALARARQAQASAQPQGRPTGFMGLPLIDPSIDAGAGALPDLTQAGRDAQGYEPSAVPFLDPINAFANRAVDSIPVVGPALTSAGNNVDAAFNNALGFPEQTAEDRARVNAGEAERFPVAAVSGDIAGTVAPLAALGTTELGAQALGLSGNLGKQALMGMISGGLLGGADTAARGGSAADVVTTGLMGAGLGGAVPLAGRVVSPVVRSLMGQGVPKEAAMLARSMKADQIDPTRAAQMVMDLGPEARLADLGPNLQGQAAAIATMPGDAQKSIVDMLKGRQAGGNARVRAAVNEILGPATTPAAFQQETTAAKRALSPAYENAFDNAKAVDTKAIADNLDSMIANTVGATRTELQGIRDMLKIAGTDDLDPFPRRLFAVRNELDDIAGRLRGTKAAPLIGDIRRQVDAELTAKVPGIKDADAKYADIMRKLEAFDLGQTILDSGRGAIRPPELSAMTANASDNVLSGLSQGARAEIDRIIGTKANDRVALQQLMKGEGSWNYDRLASTFGKDKADALLDVLGRERQFAELENLALGGSRTQPLKAAQEELRPPKPDSGVLREAMNLQFGNAGFRALDKVMGGAVERSRRQAVEKLAQALMGRGDVMTDDVTRALAQYRRGLLPAPIPGLLALPSPNNP